MKNITKLLGLFLLINYSLMAQWTNGQNASYVIGQPDFNTYSAGTTNNNLNNPSQMAIDFTNNKLYVADYYNQRVLRFAYPITSNNPSAERIFGITGSSGCTRNQLAYPAGVAVYMGTLWVSDCYNNRILKFNNAHLASTDSPNADGVLGQTDYTSKTSGISASKFNYAGCLSIDASGNMWVTDGQNNRALKFNDVNNKANGGNADLVLGQPNFTTNNGMVVNQSSLYKPYGITVSGTTVWVADYGMSRVLRFDNPTTNGVNANGVLGQINFVTSQWGCTNALFYTNADVCVDPNGTLYVSDFENSRILIFNNAASKPNGGSADFVLGQSNFTSKTINGGQNGIYSFFDGEDWYYGACLLTVDPVHNQLLVSNQEGNRIMVYGAGSPLPVELNSFTAQSEGNGVLLNWKTATEVNNYGFDVDRKSGNAGSEWVKVGFVNGSGNSNSTKEYTFTESNIKAGKYSYRLKQIDKDGGIKYSAEAEVEIKPIPTEYVLQQNYPNPFNPTTVIKYSLPFDSRVSIKVYNLTGQEVKVLKDEVISAGSQEVQFNSQGLTSGVYFYRLNAESLDGKQQYSSVKKMTFLK
jgi:sugar lactone lactonase YvrE